MCTFWNYITEDSRMLSWQVKEVEQRLKDSEPQGGMAWRKILTKKRKRNKGANENIADIYAVPETMTC